MGNRLEVIIHDNIKISQEIIQIIAEDYIEWQNG